MEKAIFLDRDGTLVQDCGYAYSVVQYELLPLVVDGLRLLKGYFLFLVTNQSGIGRGFYTVEDFSRFNSRLVADLRGSGVDIKKTYFCPHVPEKECSCRKPSPKFLMDAAEEFGVDLSSSFVIGDKGSDILFGKNGGCRTILVLTGYGEKTEGSVEPDFVARNILDAALWIRGEDRTNDL